jgi:hypothetical protein
LAAAALGSATAGRGLFLFKVWGLTMLAKIHPDLLPFATPLTDLVEDPENARQHPEQNIEEIARSLEEFGQDQPLVVQKEGMVVRKGNGRLKAARRLGWTHLACLVVDEPRLRAAARAIADNRTAELAKWDEKVLAHLLSEFQRAGGGLAGLPAVGFTEEQVKRLIGGPESPANGPGAKPDPPAGQGPPDAAESPPAPGTNQGEAGPVDQVRLVTLPMGPEDYERFQEAVSRLKSHFDTEDTTETVLESLDSLCETLGIR